MSVAAPPSQPLPAPPPRSTSLLRRPALWIGVLVISLGGIVVQRFTERTTDQKPVREELSVLSTVPAFHFVDQNAAPFESSSLAGQVWVANFIFTRCPNICPKFTAKMNALQDKSAQSLPQLRLVSFTVDPEHDTPDVLTAYGQKHHADFSRWTFARGERSELEKVIREGMLQPMEQGDPGDLNSVVHGSYFALVDAHLRVRGVYRFTEPGSVDEVLRDARLLLDP